MSISYDNYLVYGIKLNIDDCREEISPAKYEMQNRYDTKTGKVIKQEKVCIKLAEHKYIFNAYESEDFSELANDIAKFTGLKSFYDYDSHYFIGLTVIKSDDKDGARMIDGKITMNDLLDFHAKISRIFPFDSDKIALYGIASIG